jgi:hypothetical protein
MKESDLTEQINGKNSWDKSSTKQQSMRLKRQKKIINKSKKEIFR